MPRIGTIESLFILVFIILVVLAIVGAIKLFRSK